MGTHLRVLSESFQMNTNMTGFGWFIRKSLHPCALDKSSLSIGRVDQPLCLETGSEISGACSLWGGHSQGEPVTAGKSINSLPLTQQRAALSRKSNMVAWPAELWGQNDRSTGDWETVELRVYFWHNYLWNICQIARFNWRNDYKCLILNKDCRIRQQENINIDFRSRARTSWV